MKKRIEASPETFMQRFRTYPEYSDSGVEWLGPIPSHWGVDRLKSTVSSCQNGLWGDEPDGLNDIICVRVADFDRVRLRVHLSEPTFRSIDKRIVEARLLRPGDLLLEKSGGGENQPVGAVVLYDRPEPAICSNFVARMTAHAGFDSSYLTYLHYAAYSVRLNTRSIKQSTGIQNLDSSAYLNERGPLPPFPEQCAIRAFLDRETTKVDTLIAKKQKIVELLHKKLATIISEAVTKGVESSITLRGSGVEWLGDMPAHWEVKRLWHLMPAGRQIMYGIVLPGPHVPEGVPIVKGGDVSTERLKLDLLSRTASEIEARYVRSRLQGGDIVIAIRGSIGDVAVVPDELTGANMTQDAARIAVSSKVDGRWLLYALRSDAISAQLKVRSLGATIKGINIRDLKRILLPVPPKKEQEVIADFLGEEEQRIGEVAQTVAKAVDSLKDFREALIFNAVTGKIDVRD